MIEKWLKKIKRWSRREKIHAIHKNDIKTILNKFGLLDDLLKGLLQCNICGTILTLDNLQCIFMKENQVKLCCNNIDCYRQVVLKK